MAKQKTKKRTHVSVLLKKIPGSNTLYCIPNNAEYIVTSMRLPYTKKSIEPHAVLSDLDPKEIVYVISTEKTRGAIRFIRWEFPVYQVYYKNIYFYTPKHRFKLCYKGIHTTIKACTNWTDKEITRFLDNKTLYVTPYFFK
jgi:hypothetical protein